jgi:hypothetical protein
MIPIVPKPLEDYCLAHTTPAAPLLDELAAYTRAHCKLPQMLTGPVEGTFLRILVQGSGARPARRAGAAQYPRRGTADPQALMGARSVRQLMPDTRQLVVMAEAIKAP